ncbi:hypothetical protein ACYU03_10595 [Pseudomonas sp. X10]
MFGLVLGLVAGCDEKVAAQAVSHVKLDYIREFADVVKQQLVFVDGGEFLMGDFGSKFGKEELPYDSEKGSKP